MHLWTKGASRAVCALRDIKMSATLCAANNTKEHIKHAVQCCWCYTEAIISYVCGASANCNTISCGCEPLTHKPGKTHPPKERLRKCGNTNAESMSGDVHICIQNASRVVCGVNMSAVSFLRCAARPRFCLYLYKQSSSCSAPPLV